jgi:hypothetical protein
MLATDEPNCGLTGTSCPEYMHISAAQSSASMVRACWRGPVGFVPQNGIDGTSFEPRDTLKRVK